MSGPDAADQGVQGSSTSPWFVNTRNASGTETGTASNPYRNDPTGTTSQPVTQVTSPWVTSAAQSGVWSLRLQDGSGNAITSQVSGSQRALDVGIDVAGVQVDPRAQGTAAALSGYWPVRVTDGTNTQPTMDAVGRAGFQKITDGTNTMPTMDAVGRAGFQKITDGTNTMPTMDAVGRAGFQKITDGTNTAAVKAASTAASATDPAEVVTLSPNGNQATAANQTAVQGSKAAGTAATNSELNGCVYTSAGVTLTNGQQVATQCTSTGRIQVDTLSTVPQQTSPMYNGVKTRFIDMNVASGGVARGTGIASTSVYTVLFNYTGSGYLFAYLIGFEGNLVGSDNFIVKLEIDSTIIYEIDTNDIGTANLYNLNAVQDEIAMGFSLTSNVLRFTSPRSGGLYYATSIKVSIKKGTNATSKQFRAGAVYLTKET